MKDLQREQDGSEIKSRGLELLTDWVRNHARPNDVTEGYAADWTIGQLRELAQRTADRIQQLMKGGDAAPPTHG